MNLLKKQLFIFDKDDTITDTKSPLEPNMALLLANISNNKPVAIISGSSWSVFQEQIIDFLDVTTNFSNLHLLPASGSQYYTYSAVSAEWQQVYDFSIPREKFNDIKKLLLESFNKLPEKFKPAKIFSEQVENRQGQISLSALGQIAPRDLKKTWDNNRKKRQMMVEYLTPRLQDYDVKIGGSTSIDVTRKGINKEFGVRKLLKNLQLTADAAIYFGDSLGKDGNDAIVKNISNLDTIAVSGHHETLQVLKNYSDNMSN